MKKFAIFIISLVTVLAISTTVFAAGNHHRQQMNVPTQCPQHENCQYVDNNNDSICDNRTDCSYQQDCPNASHNNCNGTQIRQHHAQQQGQHHGRGHH